MEEVVPLWSNEDSQKIGVRKTQANRLQVFMYEISKTPTTGEIGKMLEVVIFYINNTDADFIFYAKHVQSERLDNIKMDLCLTLARCLMENNMIPRFKQIIMECTNVDSAAELGANLFSMTTNLPLLLTADIRKAEEQVRIIEKRC
jgi:hypothetical protein